MGLGALVIADLVLAFSRASASTLYVASYGGTVSTLSLSGNALVSKSVNTHCGSASNHAPTWLKLDKTNKVLYCLGEDRLINSFKTSVDGALSFIDQKATIKGPVSSIFFNDNVAIALAHYDGSSISTWSKSPSGTIAPIQNITFTPATSGLNPDRQAAPHEHEAILDPISHFLLFPDLGADLVRVFSFNLSTSLLSAHDPLKAALGSSLRHAVFWSPETPYTQGIPLFFFLIAELSNAITSYSVTYPKSGGLAFTEVQKVTTFGGKPVPSTAAAAGIVVSPDNKFILNSNRMDYSFITASPDPTNSTEIASNSIAVWKPNAIGILEFPNAIGILEFVQLALAGGTGPRYFSFNAAGDIVSVGLQLSENVAIIKRDVKTGKLGDIVANLAGGGAITNVIWDQ
ncbi:carboxy-cis,cis-muconate cyclase-like protein [Mytilinidion resinicola]|uniref:Carboxy-cis,cis-muconate cyclase-like protein n=1 Tax=Mytilinidion resinicola TaxID=574789 RepID=A0A6A6Y9G2_9PEZI|nr:carboxy-cis,cis-muconate cyclase-like protein [Mytilinidion resinicola]KAF2805330.1 carboxy-cis,cis-muconate cyclase-like protein [Mytilinidion resinicola]